MCVICRNGAGDSGGRIRAGGGTELLCQSQAPENIYVALWLSAQVSDDSDCLAQPSTLVAIRSNELSLDDPV